VENIILKDTDVFFHIEYNEYMKALRSVTEIPVNSRVMLRMDLDVPMHDEKVIDDSRLKKSLVTIDVLLQKRCKVLIVGHRGRPQGPDMQQKLTLQPIFLRLQELLIETRNEIVDFVFIDTVTDEERIMKAIDAHTLVCVENIRFSEKEEKNDPTFLSHVVELIDCYVNDAVSVSHRPHWSIMLFERIPAYYGIAFIHEVQQIFSIIKKDEHPITVILGGAKKDKLLYLPALTTIADHVLIGGKLPLLIQDVDRQRSDFVIVGELRPDGKDISEETMKNFISIISQSKTVIWAGAMGLFEQEDARKGTQDIARALASVRGNTIIAGGDTEASVRKLHLEENVSLIASGGGVMLELLTKKTLPAWKHGSDTGNK